MESNQAMEVVTLADAASLHNVAPDIMQKFVMDGDLSKIEPAYRPALVMALCRHIGVDPIERPFMVFADGKKVVLYAARACTSALCRERKISREVISVEERVIAGQPVIIARARATLTATGRYDESTGVVPVMQPEVEWREGANGKQYKNVVGWRNPDPTEAANLPMKAETKAKRRAVLDLVGLGMPDESEIEGIRGARVGRVDMASGEISFGDQPAIASPTEREPTVRGEIAARVSKIAGLLAATERAVFRGAVRTAGLDADAFSRTRDLDDDQARAVLAQLDAKLASLNAAQPNSFELCARLYNQLCTADPADYETDNRDREWAAMLGLEDWPEHPTTAQYGEVAEHITRILEKLDE